MTELCSLEAPGYSVIKKACLTFQKTLEIGNRKFAYHPGATPRLKLSKQYRKKKKRIRIVI